MACRLKLLGPPQLLDDQGRLIPIPVKAFALVAYILLTSGGAPVSRASLRQFLWENPDTKTAATNLRKFLLRIRQRQKQFGFELVREERDHVRVALSVEIDLARFLQIGTIQSPADLAALCDVYRGELLEGLELEEADSREWLEVQRTKLRDAFVSAVSNWMEAADPNTDKMSSRIVARRLIEVEPYNETAHRALMRLFADDGEPARVRGVYRNLEERLRADLGVRPDAATTELYRSLLPVGSERFAAALPGSDKTPTSPRTVKQDQSEEPAEIDAGPAETAANRSGTPRITILPPVQPGGQDFRHQMAGSLIEDITIGLCRFKALSVVAPHTAWQLSVSGKKALFRTFGIDYSVETQLQNVRGGVTLSVKLVDALTREILWTEQYPFDQEQSDRNYRELSIRIVGSLMEKIERSELARYEVEQNPMAYHLFLRGQRYLRVLDLPNVRRARREFKAAISSCPDFVPAISSLARTYQREWLLMARGDSELLGESERLARASIEIDPDDARGYRELGNCTLFAGRFDECLSAFELAEQRNPQHADLLADLADALSHACEPAAALEKITKAIDLNPLCPDHYWWAAGGANFHLQRYADAMECMTRMRDQSPAYRLLAASSGMLGNREQAAKYVRKTKDIHPDFSVNGWLSILPIRDPEFAHRYEQGLREAGFN
jgi:DNA-binding SARP family transcriptional activator/TolB-like protein/Tfp pilus assembly protein PilF